MKNPDEITIEQLKAEIDLRDKLVREMFAIREALHLVWECRKELETLDWVVRIKAVDLAALNKNEFFNKLKSLMKIQDS